MVNISVEKKNKNAVFSELDRLVGEYGCLTRDVIVEQAKVDGSIINTAAIEHGLLDPDKAVDFALKTWAGILLRSYKVWVTVEDKDPVKIRAMVSLTTDRRKEGGYRHISAVMSDEVQRTTMLDDAKGELGSFRKKYSILSELAPVFAEIDKIT